MCPKSHNPEGKMKFFFVCTAFILFIGCTQTPTAQKDKNIDVFEDVLRQLEKETQKQSRVYFKQLKANLENLDKECDEMRAFRSRLDGSIQKFKKEEAAFLLVLNDEQLGLYAVWYETLSKNNTSPMLVFAQRLLESLDENKKPQFRKLYASYREISQLAQSFNQKSKGFEKKKSYYLNSLKRQFPKNYANIETRVNQLLAY
jgi:uncharacterized protein YPO0396